MKYFPSTLNSFQSYLWFFLLFPPSIQAQTVPLPASPRQPELKEPELLPPQPEILPSPERPSPTPQLAPAQSPDRIIVITKSGYCYRLFSQHSNVDSCFSEKVTGKLNRPKTSANTVVGYAGFFSI